MNLQELIKYAECDWDSGKATLRLILGLILHFLLIFFVNLGNNLKIKATTELQMYMHVKALH